MGTINSLRAVGEARALAANGRAREIREAAGFSLAELAVVLGVAPKTVQRWETGESSPRAENAIRYRRLLTQIGSGCS